jgi:anti-anti-sigma regulatory factor
MRRVIVQSRFLSEELHSYEAEAKEAFAEGERVLVFDLGRVRYIDSGATDMLESLSRDAEDRGAVVLLDNLSSVAQEFLALLGLSQNFFTRLPLKAAR